MKQFPSNLKFKKYHKVNYSFKHLLDRKRFFLIKGNYGLKSEEAGKITGKQIESCRRTLRRGLKKTGHIFIRLFTNTPVTRKSVASRMGKVKGRLLFE